MELTEEQMEVYVEMKEQAALEVYRKSCGVSYQKISEPIRIALEEAFLIGYGYGGIEYENDLRKAQRDDPLTFYKWIQEGLKVDG